MWLYQKLIQICERLCLWQYTLKLLVPRVTYVIFYDSKMIGLFAHLTLGVGLLHFHEFELTAEGQERMKMMFS